MFSSLSQSFPPKATFTEKDVGDLSGQVFLITGGSSGIGKELAQILYSKNATVCIATRDEGKAHEAMDSIRGADTSSKGALQFLSLDLADLEAVARSARSFLEKEKRLDVLVNNAGVMHPPGSPKTKQGYELQLGVHNLGHVLFTETLTPLLAKTAQESPAGQVRVCWASSLYAELGSPKGGFVEDDMTYEKKDQNTGYKYSVSKAGVYYQGVEYARRHKSEGIISIPFNPGNLTTPLQRHHSSIERSIANYLITHPPINGAYTELFASLSPDVTLERSGSYVIPWGRFREIRADLHQGGIPVTEGGTGMGEKWYEWCLEQVRPFMQS